MMISSDPVVASPESADSPTVLSSPEKTPVGPNEEMRSEEKEQGGREEQEERSTEISMTPSLSENKANSETEGTKSTTDEIKEGEEEQGSLGASEEEHGNQLQLSVPDLINKDPPPESRAKPCDIWLRASSPDSRLASSPISGKVHCRISLGEEVLLGNGAPCSKESGGSTEETEPHPDLLSFE